jgi:S-adenosylmethionine hydrolase
VFLTFLSDYGAEDEFVGVCHGVIARIAPQVRVLDITHGITRHDVRSGALILARALPYFPAGVHLAVVDPEVGTPRRAVALRTADDGRVLVGPDNGLLWLAVESLGGIVEAVDISLSEHRLEPVAATFHGRDIFAPVAAQLATGAALAEAGEPLDPDTVVRMEVPFARVEGETLHAHALAVDRYGNVMLDVEHGELLASGLRLGEPLRVNGTPASYARTFADVGPGELLVYEDAYRTLALAVNRGSAVEFLGLELDGEVRLEPA